MTGIHETKQQNIEGKEIQKTATAPLDTVSDPERRRGPGELTCSRWIL
jgi:hypothetical protein